jgi:hypothetical protein
MKTSDLKVGQGYAYYPRVLTAWQDVLSLRTTCAIPLDTKFWTEYYEYDRTTGRSTLKYKPGRKRAGYYPPSNGVEMSVIQSGVPCMLAEYSGAVQGHTPWRFVLINPIYLATGWDGVRDHYEERDRRERAEYAAQQLAERQRMQAFGELNEALSSLGPTAFFKKRQDYQIVGFVFSTFDEMSWLTRFIRQYNEQVETIKDLEYELDG